jgi:hypothetical protein
MTSAEELVSTAVSTHSMAAVQHAFRTHFSILPPIQVSIYASCRTFQEKDICKGRSPGRLSVPKVTAERVQVFFSLHPTKFTAKRIVTWSYRKPPSPRFCTSIYTWNHTKLIWFIVKCTVLLCSCCAVRSAPLHRNCCLKSTYFFLCPYSNFNNRSIIYV